MPDEPQSTSNLEDRFEAILVACLRAEEAGKPLDLDALILEHPDLSDELRSFFHNRDVVARLVKPLQTHLWPPEVTDSGNEVDAAPIEHGRYFGEYELLRELGRGGMGIVYEAKQATLNRIVALKLILAGKLASAQDVERFRREAEAAASLDHPNITPIFEVGEHEGQQYFSMRLVTGKTLAADIAEMKGAPRQIAQLLAVLSRAVHHAHQRGILHRDLKPANILIDAQGEPQITDFGLARRVDGESELTQSGAIVGTPSYMAPEQARGMRVLTTGVDIYALGAILYHALAGEPPFSGTSPIDVLRQVVETEPIPLRSKYARVNKDLETICLRCLEKAPVRRYESAAALADDLERWLRHEPINARNSGPFRRLGKWARRHPAVTMMIGIVVAAASAVGWQWRTAVVAVDIAERELHRNRLALADRDVAGEDMFSARQWLLDVPPEKRAWEWKCIWQSTYVTPANRFTEQPSVIIQACVRNEGNELVTLQYDGLVQAWDLNTLGVLREWTAYPKSHGMEGHFDGPLCSAFSGDGRFLAIGIEGRSDARTVRVPNIKVLNVDTGKVVFSQERRAITLTLNSDGTLLYAITEDSPDPDKRESLVAWNLTSGECVFETEHPVQHESHWERLFAAVGGEQLYDLGGRRIYSARDGRVLKGIEITLASNSGNYFYRSPLTVNPSEKTIAWALEQDGVGEALLLDLESGAARQIPTSFAVHRAAFSSDGRYVALVVQTPDWDLPAMMQKESLPTLGGKIALPSKSRPYLHSVYVHDARDGRLIRTLRGFPGWIHGLAFIDDDRKLVAVGGLHANQYLNNSNPRGDIVVWNVGEAGAGRLLARCASSICSISISHNCEFVAASNNDGNVSVWNLSTGQLLQTGSQRRDVGQPYVAFAPDGRLLAVSGERKLAVIDAATGQVKWATPIDSNYCGPVAWHPHSRQIAMLIDDGAVFVDAETGTVLHKNSGFGRIIYSPDGRFLARPTVHDAHGELGVFQSDMSQRVFLKTTETYPAFFSTGHGLLDAAFSPDGKMVVGVGNNGPGLVFEVPSGRKMFDLQRRDESLWCVAVSPDGARIATGGSDGAVRFWDAATGDEIHAFLAHNQAVHDVAFSPDGLKLVSGGRDGKIMIWEVPGTFEDVP